ncbi:MarR family winged helix-turn-helix transcriptional regulator [Hellea balneolensis]|uniref:MarR family winged helix-turn-helix transcriptional regulator n=1 Tax=Hellea balneolensis TaxID=287478 RepID=UPI000417928D|nr:MarR family transcriptional regulator [Hellea balneolensis]
MNKEQMPLITLDDFWPYQAVVLADQISRHTLSVVKAEAGLNLSQWRVLAAVAEQPGRTAADVTAITPMDKTIVSRAVSSLIEEGLISKISDVNDKRRSSLSTTQSGQDIYTRVAARLNATLMGDTPRDASPQEFTLMLKAYSEKLRTL